MKTWFVFLVVIAVCVCLATGQPRYARQIPGRGSPLHFPHKMDVYTTGNVVRVCINNRCTTIRPDQMDRGTGGTGVPGGYHGGTGVPGGYHSGYRGTGGTGVPGGYHSGHSPSEEGRFLTHNDRFNAREQESVRERKHVTCQPGEAPLRGKCIKEKTERCTGINSEFSDFGDKRLMECSPQFRHIIKVPDRQKPCPPGEKWAKGRCRKIYNQR